MPNKVALASVLWLSFSRFKIGDEPMSKPIRVDWADMSEKTAQNANGLLLLAFDMVYLNLQVGFECTEEMEFYIPISEFQMMKSADGIVLRYVGKNSLLIKSLKENGYSNKISEQESDDMAWVLKRM